MRIAILSPFHPFRVGLAQFNTRLYKELEKQNDIRAFSFSTLYPSILFPGKTQFVDKDDNDNYIDSERILNSINPISYLSTAKAINRYSPDILIIPYWMSFLAPAFGTVIRFLDKKIKVVALVHNAIPHEKHFFDTAFAKYFFSKCDAFIVMSDFVKIDLSKLLPTAKILLREHPIFDQYNERISKEEASLKLNIETEKKNLLFFGLIREYKGLDLLIEAIDYLDDTYQLVIGGECYGDFKKYQDLIDRSKFKENIKIFEQYIPDDMVTDLFSIADLLVLPYRSATQSGVVAVAYQLEVPMLATNVGALGKTVQEAKVGIVTENISPESIAQGIRTFFADSKRDQYLKNIQLEKARLSWASFTQSIEEFSTSL